MNANLMFPNKPFDLEAPLPVWSEDLVADLELDTLISAMAGPDEQLAKIARAGLLHTLDGTEDERQAVVAHRQAVLADCLMNEPLVYLAREMAHRALQLEHSSTFRIFGESPSTHVYRDARVLPHFLDTLQDIQEMAAEHAKNFSSKGFVRLFHSLSSTATPEYLAELRAVLDELQFKDGMVFASGIGPGGRAKETTVLAPLAKERGWRSWMAAHVPDRLQYRLDPHDESGHRALGELIDLGLADLASVLGKTVAHLRQFMTELDTELGFFLAAVQLKHRLDAMGVPTCVPGIVSEQKERGFRFEGLYDVCLALRTNGQIVVNDVNAASRSLIVITGANQGGKSTLLRAIGQAHILARSGLYSPAVAHETPVPARIFTHFARAEDASLSRGKFEEELVRMAAIVDHVCPGALVLMNESLSATNEREGAQIAHDLLQALVEGGVQCVTVTHFFALAEAFGQTMPKTTLFLQPQLGPEGARTFKLAESAVEETSHAWDIFTRVFDKDPESQLSDGSHA